MIRRAVFLLFFLILFTSSEIFASGFFTPEVGAKAVGRGGAFVASTDDLSALYLNPGALSRVKGTNFLIQCNWDIMRTWYRRESYQPAVRNRNPLDTIPYLALSSDFRLEDWTFAFGVYGPYGVTQRYPYNGPQRYSVLEANSVQLFFAAGIGWHPLRWLRIGLNIMATQFSKEDYYGYSVLGDHNPKYDVTVRFVAESDYMPTWAAGIILEPVPWFELGFSYIAPSDPLLQGTLSAELPEFYALILGYDVYEDDITVQINYPEMYRGGVRYIFKDIFDIELAFSFIPWSKLKTFPVDLTSEELIADFDLPLYWEDSWSVRLGGTARYEDHWEFHLGYFHEDPATPEKTLGPGGIEAKRDAPSIGITMKYFGFDITFAYAHVFMEDRENANPNKDSELGDGRGQYKGSFDHLVGAMNINFEKVYYTFKGRGPKKKGNK